jgi:hypothetical protein
MLVRWHSAPNASHMIYEWSCLSCNTNSLVEVSSTSELFAVVLSCNCSSIYRLVEGALARPFIDRDFTEVAHSRAVSYTPKDMAYFSGVFDDILFKTRGKNSPIEWHKLVIPFFELLDRVASSGLSSNGEFSKTIAKIQLPDGVAIQNYPNCTDFKIDIEVGAIEALKRGNIIHFEKANSLFIY